MHTRRERRLIKAGYLFMFGSAIHTFDHLRRGQQSVTDELNWLGTTGLVLQAVVITLILTRHRAAPLLAAGAGFSLALGFFAAHWLPRWSEFSDSFVDNGASTFSYVASVAEIVGALGIGIAGYALYWNQPRRTA